MTRWFAAFVVATGIVGAGQAYAQGPGSVVVTAIPTGGAFFTESKNPAQGPSFGNYGVGGAVELGLTRYIGIEGELTGAIGVSQDVNFVSGTQHVKSPNLLNYSGNVVVSAPNRSAFVPYATGGIGGLSLFEKASLGINSTETFLTGNVGGGVKWFYNHFGLRADYRFVAAQSKDNASSFFGQENRYGHRVYAGVLINTGR